MGVRGGEIDRRVGGVVIDQWETAVKLFDNAFDEHLTANLDKINPFDRKRFDRRIDDDEIASGERVAHAVAFDVDKA